MKKAVFLDRDGVLNRTDLVYGIPKPPANLGNIEILPGVIEAIEILKKNDFVPVVVTNQPDVARGVIRRSDVEEINSAIGQAIGIRHFYTCFHDDSDFCDCRKPAPGLIYRASLELHLSIKDSFLVGDRWRDISAGQAAGCQSFFIDYSYRELKPKMPFKKVSSLLEAVKIIVGEKNETKFRFS